MPDCDSFTLRTWGKIVAVGAKSLPRVVPSGTPKQTLEPLALGANIQLCDRESSFQQRCC
jgi:hypothetical protein